MGATMAALLAKATSEMQVKSKKTADIAAGKLTPNGIPKLDRNFKFPTKLLCPSGLTKHSTKMMTADGLNPKENEKARSFLLGPTKPPMNQPTNIPFANLAFWSR